MLLCESVYVRMRVFMSKSLCKEPSLTFSQLWFWLFVANVCFICVIWEGMHMHALYYFFWLSLYLCVSIPVSVCARKRDECVRLTHPLASAAAAWSKTRSGPCLSKHTSRYMQHTSSGQEIPHRGGRQELIDKGRGEGRRHGEGEVEGEGDD